jgi:alanine dehydrogenase
LKIGIRREDKNPLEVRVPIIPEDVRRLVHDGSIPVVLEASPGRVLPDREFIAAGATVRADLADCPLVLGIKEIPVHKLEPEKTYIFFAHVIKGQPHNMPMLRRLMELGCQLIDYECIVDDRGRRLVFFGRFAGLAGMIDTLWALGRRLAVEGVSTPFARLQQALRYSDLDQAKAAVAEVGHAIRAHGLPRGLRPLVCGFAGYGNVSRGAQEIYDLLPVEPIAPEQLPDLTGDPDPPGDRVFKVVFQEEHLVSPIDPNGRFELHDYYQHPEKYRSRFSPWVEHLTLLVNCIFWTPKYPKLVTKTDLKSWYSGGAQPRLRVVGDISCDVNGSMECNVRVSDPANPVYVYDPFRDEAIDGVEGTGPVVLAVEMLPAELPADASREFSRALMPFVPALARADYSVPFDRCDLPPEIKRAVIVYHGKLTERYRYLEEFLR